MSAHTHTPAHPPKYLVAAFPPEYLVAAHPPGHPAPSHTPGYPALAHPSGYPAPAHSPGYPALAHTPGYPALLHTHQDIPLLHTRQDIWPAYEPPLEHTPVFLDPHDPLNQHGLLSLIYYDTVNLTIPPIWQGTIKTLAHTPGYMAFVPAYEPRLNIHLYS